MRADIRERWPDCAWRRRQEETCEFGLRSSRPRAGGHQARRFRVGLPVEGYRPEGTPESAAGGLACLSGPPIDVLGSPRLLGRELGGGLAHLDVGRAQLLVHFR